MSMYAIEKDGRRIGSVWKIAGEPKARRWTAFASGDRKKGFPTLQRATEWLHELDEADSKEQRPAH